MRWPAILRPGAWSASPPPATRSPPPLMVVAPFVSQRWRWAIASPQRSAKQRAAPLQHGQLPSRARLALLSVARSPVAPALLASASTTNSPRRRRPTWAPLEATSPPRPSRRPRLPQRCASQP
eukprot:2584243-Alexandrium_andersonii.AAC.1